ncbi:MAG: tRNA 5-methoxyuridine(34)/uridine 5-oxyacetic acid(34) synthase CmoB [Pseudomonadota bacterium]
MAGRALIPEPLIGRVLGPLEAALSDSSVDPASWVSTAHTALRAVTHGDLPRWLAALDRLPSVDLSLNGQAAAPQLGADADDVAALRDMLMELHPWRKGPLVLGGVNIDTEWRSDWKWTRLAPHLKLAGATVLDVGCGNGYFGWRMLGAGARCVVGIDPTILFVMQWLAQCHFAGPQPNFVLPLRDTDIPCDAGGFDCVLSLGVLYHRRDPADHLRRLVQACRPGGQLIVESLVVEQGPSLHPKGRYARMRNVHEVASVDTLLAQVSGAGGVDPEVVELTPTTVEEQRSTDWMRFESLAQCLDPGDPSRTLEGHPAPVRAIVVATVA